MISNNNNNNNNGNNNNKLLLVQKLLIENTCKIIYPRNLGFFRYIILHTPHRNDK